MNFCRPFINLKSKFLLHTLLVIYIDIFTLETVCHFSVKLKMQSREILDMCTNVHSSVSEEPSMEATQMPMNSGINI